MTVITALIILNFAAIAIAANEPTVGDKTHTITSPFKDVAATDPNLVFVKYITQKGIISGFPDGSFHPSEGITRAQAAVVIVKATGLEVPAVKTSSFEDLPASYWATSYIAAAVKAGYLKGFPDGTCKPDEKLTRAQGISLIMRLCTQKERATLPEFQDMNKDHWAAGDMATALSLEMIGMSKDGKQIYPEAEMTRVNLARALAILLTKDPGLNQAQLSGRIKDVKGTITLTRNNNAEPLKNDMTIIEGDIIKSYKDGQANMVYPDGSSTLIEPSSEIVVKKSQGRSYIKTDGSLGVAVEFLNLELKEGSLFGALATKREETTDTTDNEKAELDSLFASGDSFRQLAAAEPSQPWYKTAEKKKVKMKVDMPWGIAAIRGTFFKASVNKDRGVVLCLAGNVDVSSNAATVPLTNSQSCLLTGQNAPPGAANKLTQSEVQQEFKQQQWLVDTALQMDLNQEAKVADIIAEVPGAEPVQTAIENTATTLEVIIDALHANGIQLSHEIIEYLNQKIEQIQEEQLNPYEGLNITEGLEGNNNQNNNNNNNTTAGNTGSTGSTDTSSGSQIAVYNEPGKTYGPEDGQPRMTIYGAAINAEGITLRNMNIISSLTVNKKNTILQNVTVNGNLTLGAGIDEGNVTLNNVTVKGNTVINGGGKSVLNGSFTNIDIQAPGITVEIQSGTIDKMTVAATASGSIITLAAGVTVNNLEVNAAVNIGGSGQIINAAIYASGVKIAQEPQNCVLGQGVSAVIGSASPPSAITLSKGSTRPVYAVSNVALPLSGGTDATGTVTGWVYGEAETIKFTVTDSGAAASSITINGAAYTSGSDYIITSTSPLNIVVTTSETNKATEVRAFIVSVTPAPVVNILPIPGVMPPVTGGTSVTSITETAQYTGTVSWTPNDHPFKGSKVYTASIILNAKPGVTLTGVGVNTFTVAGAVYVSNPANSGVITAEFPATALGVAPGYLHSLALKSDGTVVAWGYNNLGQCTVPTGLSGVTAIEGGNNHSLALKSDGTVVAWGTNNSGQCNVPTGLSGVTAISAGGGFSLALKNDGTVVAWGYNGYGQCSVPAGLSGVTSISAGGSYSLALKSTGTVVAWGYNVDGECNVPAGLSGVTAIAAGGHHSLALKSDGTVVAWGKNGNGQCTIPSGLSGVTAISAGGGSYSLALKSDGTVVAWGANNSGQCNVPTGLSGVATISTGDYHSLALKSDGTVVAWGRNNEGQCNIPTTGVLVINTNYSTPQPGSEAGTTKIANLDYASIAGASKWKMMVRDYGWGVPIPGEKVNGAVDYVAEANINITAGQHILLLATDNNGIVKAYADIAVGTAQIKS